MAIFFRGKFPSGRVSANFKLPGGGDPLEPKVQVAWMDDSGRAGLRFFDLTKELREQLDQWLTAQCEKAEKRIAIPPLTKFHHVAQISATRTGQVVRYATQAAGIFTRLGNRCVCPLPGLPQSIRTWDWPMGSLVSAWRFQCRMGLVTT
jgi:hypothetical protein